MPASPDRGEGYIYAVTGEEYLILARRAARSLRRVDPDRPIDLFTDAAVEDPVFDRVHRLERVSIRPKIEAMRRARFARTLYLDADTIPLAPLDDVFGVLERFDMALCAEQRRADFRARRQMKREPVPLAFPQPNSGVVALRPAPVVLRLLEEWERWAHDGTQSFDQHSLRVLLYRSEVRLHTLPDEYNMMWYTNRLANPDGHCAPRILHQPILHKLPPGDPEAPFDLGVLLDAEQMEALRHILSRDLTLERYIDPGTALEERPKPRPRSFKHKLYDALRRRL